jgi:RND family efflux transporter MFP subunit
MPSALLLLPVLLALAGTPVSVAAQQPPAGPPPVTVAEPVKQQVTDHLEFTGQFSAVDLVELRARVSGYLDHIAFTDGQFVNKGDLLFVIDPRPYEIALASERGRLAQAEAELELAKRQFSRAGELRQQQAVPEATFDERAQRMRSARAAIEIAKAAVRNAELTLEFTRVTAPISGRIGAHQVSVGNLIGGGGEQNATLLATIVSSDPIYFTFDVSEADFLAFKRAAGSDEMSDRKDVPVDLRLLDETGWPRQARIDFVDTQIERTTGTIRVRAVLPNPDRLITPGQFGRARLPASAPYEALLVPDPAVLTDQANRIVMTVAEDGSVVPKSVQPGQLLNGLRVIKSGLQPTDKVVINGLMRARPGTKVMPQPGKIELSALKAN